MRLKMVVECSVVPTYVASVAGPLMVGLDSEVALYDVDLIEEGLFLQVVPELGLFVDRPVGWEDWQSNLLGLWLDCSCPGTWIYPVWKVIHPDRLVVPKNELCGEVFLTEGR